MSHAKKISDSSSTCAAQLKSTPLPSLKITQQSYDCDRDNIIFLLSDDAGNTFEKTAGEIALNNAMIAALSSNDTLLIGYIAGMEHADFNHLNC